MSLWNSRTKMEHAKTRPIKIEDKKANGHDEEEELDEEEIEAKLKLSEKNVLSLGKEIDALKHIVEEQNKEIKRLRELNENNTLFMQQIILELINKPAPKTAVQSYLETKSANIAGPKGKLP